MAQASSDFNSILRQLQRYKRKFYVNQLLRGSIYFGALVLSVYLLFNSIEYTARLNSFGRATLLFLFLLVFAFFLYRWVLAPVLRLAFPARQMSDEEAARRVGGHFPNVQDKLLNMVQLNRADSRADNSLVLASIAHRTQQLSVVPFPLAINLKKNLRYLRYLALPTAVIAVLLMFIPQFFSEGTTRIVNFNKEYRPEAPFSFDVETGSVTAFKNEDLPVRLRLSGRSLPDKVYLNASGRRFRMLPDSEGMYEHVFQNLQRNTSYHIEAAGFSSPSYDITVVDRPNLKNFSVYLDYPDYLQRKDERIENVGNLQVPEGTEVRWQFGTLAADSMTLTFEKSGETYPLLPRDDATFTFKKQALTTDHYRVDLQNQYSSNLRKIRYLLDVVPDRLPEISLDQMQDTTLYRFLVLGGNVSDDYGLARLALFYKFESDDNPDTPTRYRAYDLPINRKQNTQSYYHQWDVDTLRLKPGDKIRYFMKVWDNDAINGYKSTKTSTYVFQVPDQKTVRENLDKSSSETQSKISQTVQQAEQLEEAVDDLEKKLRGKKELNWQDKQKLEDILKQREALEKQLQELQEQNELMNQQREQFDERSEKMQKQISQLQNLMDELLDEETKKMYEELKKLLDEQQDIDQMQEKLQQINDQEQNLEEELERALELFKRMKLDMKLEDLEQQLNELAGEQEDLADKTDDKEEDTEQLSEQQESLNEEFKEVQEEMNEMQEMNQDLKNPSPMEDFSQDQQQIQEEQQQAKEALDEKKRSKAQKSQQKSSQKMQQMAQKMQQMQQSMEMESLQEDMDNLRNILDNLITLSFDQEKVMKDFRDVKQNDPRFIDLSQEQLKLMDDAQIIEDSLLALANRVFQIQSFVTREVKDMNKYMENSVESLRERQQFKAIGEQQFAMTSINNLALLLNDVLSQMQQQMADAMGKPQQKQGNTRANMSLSELQKQLNQDIQELKKSGKSGRALSEELAKLAQQQEKIRQAMQEQGQEESEGGGGTGDEIAKQMEQTEQDLVNKQLTQELIERQKQIMTRLLKAEESMREQELDNKRKGETAKDDYEQRTLERFDEYIKLKEQEIELLKTVPVRLNPYYKNEANEYFKRLD
jgi:hypothetical protein